MKAVIILSAAVFLLLAVGTLFLTITDIPAGQKNVSKTINNERFFDAH